MFIGNFIHKPEMIINEMKFLTLAQRKKKKTEKKWNETTNENK